MAGPHSPGSSLRRSGAGSRNKLEAAFIDGFIDAPDPVSFLRLGRIPVRNDRPPTAPNLICCASKSDALADVGSLTSAPRRRIVPVRSPAAGQPGFASAAPALRLFDGEKAAPAAFADGAAP